MRHQGVIALVIATFFTLEGCRLPLSFTSNKRSKAVPASVAQGVGNGLNSGGTGFVWEKGELPICYSARVGVKVFVWKEQATFACEKGRKEWRAIGKKG